MKKLILLLPLLTGCALFRPNPNFAYVGKPIDDYILTHRLPDKTYTSGDKTLYEWEHCVGSAKNYCTQDTVITKDHNIVAFMHYEPGL